MPDASRISPPRIDDLHPDAALISINGKLDARFLDGQSVSSGTHPVIVRHEKQHILVTLPQQGHVPDRDFVLRWQEQETSSLQLRSVSCKDHEYQYAVIRLDAPKDAAVDEKQGRDYYFLVDRSGSMAGEKWTCTARALKAFINELGDLDRVWVTLFETSFQDFADAPLPTAELKSDPAFNALDELGTGGGTELSGALHHVLEQINLHSGARDPMIIVITDGQIGNEKAVLEQLRQHRRIAIHTFGIDTAVNDAFLKQIAAQHRGTCVLMTPNDDIQGAISRLGSRLRRPVLTALVVPTDWEMASAALPDVYAGEHIVLALRGPIDASTLEISGNVADQIRRTYRFELMPEPLSSPRLLWTRQSIDRLLAEAQPRQAIDLAVKHNLVCEGASFIAYDVEEKVPVAAQEIYQPSLDTADLAASIKPACAPLAAAKVSISCNAAAPLAGGGLKRLRAASALTAAVVRAAPAPPPGRMAEIKELYSAGKTQIPLRTQILLDQFKRRADRLPIFQGTTGILLRDILVFWAQNDVVQKIPLLDQLLDSLQNSKDYAPLEKFCQLHVTEQSVRDNLLWLAELTKQGAA